MKLNLNEYLFFLFLTVQDIKLKFSIRIKLLQYYPQKNS